MPLDIRQTIPLAVKGDLLGRTTTQNVRIPVGADGLVLTANSAVAAGVDWQPGGGGAGRSPYPTPDPAEVPPYVRYVTATTGNDAANGRTSPTAWRTWAKARTWLAELVDVPCVIILDGDFQADAQNIELCGVKTVRDGCLLVCGVINPIPIQSGTFTVVSPTPTDILSNRRRVAVNAGILPANPCNYMVRLMSDPTDIQYCSVLDYDAVGGTWFDVASQVSIGVPGTWDFYDTQTKADIIIDNSHGDGTNPLPVPTVPQDYEKSIGIVGIRQGLSGLSCYGSSGLLMWFIQQTDVDDAYSSSSVFSNCSALDIGYILDGCQLVGLLNAYYYIITGPLSSGSGYYCGIVADRNVFVSNTQWNTVSYSNMYGGTSSLTMTSGNNNSYQFSLFNSTYLAVSEYNTTVQFIVSMAPFNVIGQSNITYLVSPYFHSGHGVATFAGSILNVNDSVITLHNSVNATIIGGGPSAIYLSKSTLRCNSLGSSTINAAAPLISMANSNICGIDYWSGGLFTLPSNYTGSPVVGDALIMMEENSEFTATNLVMPTAYSVNPMPIASLKSGSKLILKNSVGGGGIDISTGGVGMACGIIGAIVADRGSYVEYDNVVGTNTSVGNIFLNLRYQSTAFHPAAGTNPGPGSALSIGNAIVAPYPAGTTNDLLAPVSELCILSR